MIAVVSERADFKWPSLRFTKLTIRTHETCIRIIDKLGPLNDPADRDHCIQYTVAVPLIFGRLTAEDYDNAIARDLVWGKRIDELRARIMCVEDSRYTADYHDPQKRSIANALTLELADGTVLPEVAVEYPIGHRLRRSEGIPLLIEKFRNNLVRRLPTEAQDKIFTVSSDQMQLEATPVSDYVDLYSLPY